MIRYIHRSENIEKELKRLHRIGKNGELVQNRYQKILADMRQYSCHSETVAGKRTKKGEQRIKNCIKYDLGCGYRLVTIRQGTDLFLPFVGDHDDTDHWLERHRFDNFKPDLSTYETENLLASVKEQQKGTQQKREERDDNDLYEEQLQARLDPEMLRYVFKGLARNNNPSATL